MNSDESPPIPPPKLKIPSNSSSRVNSGCETPSQGQSPDIGLPPPPLPLKPKSGSQRSQRSPISNPELLSPSTSTADNPPTIAPKPKKNEIILESQEQNAVVEKTDTKQLAKQLEEQLKPRLPPQQNLEKEQQQQQQDTKKEEEDEKKKENAFKLLRNTLKGDKSKLKLKMSEEEFSKAGPESEPSSKSEFKPDTRTLRKKSKDAASLLDLFAGEKSEKNERPKISEPKISIVTVKHEESEEKIEKEKKWYESIGVQVDLSTLTPGEIKRQEIIFELIETEESYIRDLGIIIDVFQAEALKLKVITQKDSSILFSNIEPLKKLNEELLKSFREEQSKGIVLNVGNIFIQMSSYLRMYNVYCSNQPNALELLTKLKENDDFHNFLKQAQSKKECRNLLLSTFLLEPVQRLCKYPLFLRDLAKNTPADHVDYEKINKAQIDIEKIVEEVNTRKKFMENQQKICAIQEICDFSDQKNFVLIIPTRVFVREGLLEKSSSKKKMIERHAFLFNDILMLCSRNKLSSNYKFQVRQVIPLEKSILVDIRDSEDGKMKNLFKVVHIADAGERNTMYVLATADANQKKEWMTDLKGIIKTCRDGDAADVDNSEEEYNEDDSSAGHSKSSSQEIPGFEPPNLDDIYYNNRRKRSGIPLPRESHTSHTSQESQDSRSSELSNENTSPPESFIELDSQNPTPRSSKHDSKPLPLPPNFNFSPSSSKSENLSNETLSDSEASSNPELPSKSLPKIPDLPQKPTLLPKPSISQKPNTPPKPNLPPKPQTNSNSTPPLPQKPPSNF